MIYQHRSSNLLTNIPEYTHSAISVELCDKLCGTLCKKMVSILDRTGSGFGNSHRCFRGWRLAPTEISFIHKKVVDALRQKM